MTDRSAASRLAPPPVADESAGSPSSRRRAPWPVAGCAAALAGLAMLFAFPPYDQWWLAPVAVALLAVAVHRRRARAGAALGALTGLVFFVPLLSWAALEIDAAPWLLLSVSQAAFVAALGAAAAYLSPLIDRAPLTWPLWVAVLWVAQEALRSRIPFGGFPWGRLAFSQADSPLLPVAAVGGAPLVSAATALVGGLLAAAVWRLAAAVAPNRCHRAPTAQPQALRAGALRAGALLAAAGAVLLASFAVPQRQPDGPPVTVAIVQGNVPRLGLDFNSQRRAVLDNHVRATEELARQVGRGEATQPDLVVWPENSSDIDPLANPDAGDLIGGAADAIDAPILVGAIVRDPEAAGPYNVGLVWQPGDGPGEMYAKRQPVPFAEYLPMRPVVEPIARWLTGDDVDRIGGFAAGAEPGVLQLGPAQVGAVICFEVAYDGLVRDSVVEGAELLAVQTNNATFNEAEAYQQLAMVRLRAVEHGRESLMASTVGISGFVGVDGRVSHATGFFTQDVPVRTLSLASGRTMATTVGVWPEALLAVAALAGVAAAFVIRRRSRMKAIDVNERST